MLMMMRAFAPSAAIASDAITTSSLACGLGSGSQSKNSRCYLKLIRCLCLKVVHRPKNFIKTGQKTYTVEPRSKGPCQTIFYIANTNCIEESDCAVLSLGILEILRLRPGDSPILNFQVGDPIRVC